jgi:hypothetical protein
MKARVDLKPNSPTVLSNPNDYYIDPYGRVNELENDEERILFGTVAHLSAQARWFDETSEEKLWEQATKETRIAGDPQSNPHLRAINSIIEILDKK